MAAFLQTYGSLIIFGLLLVLMFRMHSGGHAGHGGCGGMTHHDNQHDDSQQQRANYIVDADPVMASPTATNQDGSSIDGRNDRETSPLGSFDSGAVSSGDKTHSSEHVSSHAGCH